ncbi:MAG: type II secretion system protein [Tissierellia bacterium]|nr:type II secretion system protein [Tissierellia bacterium]
MKLRGFTFVEVIISLGLVAMVILLLFPLYQKQLFLFRSYEAREEFHIYERYAWEKVIGGERNHNEEIHGKFDSYIIKISSKPQEEDIDYVVIEIIGRKYGRKKILEGYVESTGLFSF